MHKKKKLRFIAFAKRISKEKSIAYLMRDNGTGYDTITVSPPAAQKLVLEHRRNWQFA